MQLTTRMLGRLAVATALFASATAGASEPTGFLDDAQVRETLVGHTLKGKDWIEYYTAAGEIVGKVRHLGVRDYTGRWSVTAGKVCYVYGHPSVDTCSWLRRDADRVTHHRPDGALKKDGVAVRMPGNRLEGF